MLLRFLIVRLLQNQTIKAIRLMTATPPMTPPATAIVDSALRPFEDGTALTVPVLVFESPTAAPPATAVDEDFAVPIVVKSGVASATEGVSSLCAWGTSVLDPTAAEIAEVAVMLVSALLVWITDASGAAWVGMTENWASDDVATEVVVSATLTGGKESSGDAAAAGRGDRSVSCASTIEVDVDDVDVEEVEVDVDVEVLDVVDVVSFSSSREEVLVVLVKELVVSMATEATVVLCSSVVDVVVACCALFAFVFVFPPPLFADLGTAVHLFPLILVMNAPAGRFGLDIVKGSSRRIAGLPSGRFQSPK